jgi:hypothetical protein
LTENTPFPSKCQAGQPSIFTLIGILKILAASSGQRLIFHPIHLLLEL